MQAKSAVVAAFFFHRSAEVGGGYHHLIKPAENAPAELVDKVTKLHTALNDRLHELRDPMCATTPIVADGIAYTVATRFTKLTASGERPRLQMLAVAVASILLKNADIDPMEFVLGIHWAEFGEWQASERYEVRLTNETILSVAQSKLADELLSRHRGDSEAFRALSADEKAAILSRVIRTRSANERYNLTLAYDLPDSIIFLIEPAFCICRKLPESDVVEPEAAQRKPREDRSNTSGSRGGTMPPHIARLTWNWGAFVFSWIWLAAHKRYLAAVMLICAIIGVGALSVSLTLTSIAISAPCLLAYLIFLGRQGNKIAWESRRFESAKHYLDVQTAWQCPGGCGGLVIIGIVLWFFYYVPLQIGTVVGRYLPAIHLPSPGSTPVLPPPAAVRGKTTHNPKDGAGVIEIPAGEFVMGEDGSSGLQRHAVYLNDYYIYKNDVTVAMYRKFCSATGRAMPPAPAWGWDNEDNPIVNVTWDDAVAYARWAGATLPTEAQWEKAARGTDGREYPWGNDWDEFKCVNSLNVNSTADAGDSQSAPPTVSNGPKSVGTLNDGASPYGVLDMAGNVWQWCSDWYGAGYYRHSPKRNPSGPSSPTGVRVLRGGSWSDGDVGLFRCANRGQYDPMSRNDNFGFRCVWHSPPTTGVGIRGIAHMHPDVSPSPTYIDTQQAIAKLAQNAAQHSAVRQASSSFIKDIFGQCGIHLPDSAQMQAAVGYDVPLTEVSVWVPGDRMYFAFHNPYIDDTAVYIGNGNLVHVTKDSHVVVVNTVYNPYYAAHLVAVRRSRELLAPRITDDDVDRQPIHSHVVTPDRGGVIGQLAVVTSQTANITDPATGRVLSICTKGQRLAISGRSDGEYHVVMVDKSRGDISVDDVKLLKFQVISNSKD